MTNTSSGCVRVEALGRGGPDLFLYGFLFGACLLELLGHLVETAAQLGQQLLVHARGDHAGEDGVQERRQVGDLLGHGVVGLDRGVEGFLDALDPLGVTILVVVVELLARFPIQGELLFLVEVAGQQLLDQPVETLGELLTDVVGARDLLDLGDAGLDFLAHVSHSSVEHELDLRPQHGDEAWDRGQEDEGPLDAEEGEDGVEGHVDRERDHDGQQASPEREHVVNGCSEDPGRDDAEPSDDDRNEEQCCVTFGQASSDLDLGERTAQEGEEREQDDEQGL